MQAANTKSVGIIGAGRIGTVMAQIARRAGRQVVISNSRGPQSLTSLVQALGQRVIFLVGAPLAGHNLIRLP